MFSWLGLTISHTITAAAAAAAAAEDDDDNNDESYTGSNQSDISLGSDDTEIEEEELADILADATMPPTPKKPASSAKKAASAKKQKDPVLELAKSWPSKSLIPTVISCFSAPISCSPAGTET